MNIRVQRENGISRLKMEGELTIYQASEIRQELIGHLADCDEMEIDLAGVVEMDTAGCQLLLAAKHEGLQQGKSVRFVSHSQAALEIIDLFQMAAQFGDPLLIPAQR